MIEIREARVDDFSCIHDLNCEEMNYDYPESETKKKMEKILNSPKDKILVAVAGDAVIGYVHATDYDVIYAPHMKNIMGIAVSKDYKRQGVGKMLLSGIEEWAGETGAAAIRLVSGSERKDAHAFYCACGYSRKKQQENFGKDLHV